MDAPEWRAACRRMVAELTAMLAAHPGTSERAVVVGLCFVAILIWDWSVNRWLERRTVRVGSFPIVLAAFGGLELYGLNGALLFVLGAVLAVSVISEIGPEEVAEVLASTPSPSGAGSAAPPPPPPGPSG